MVEVLGTDGLYADGQSIAESSRDLRRRVSEHAEDAGVGLVWVLGNSREVMESRFRVGGYEEYGTAFQNVIQLSLKHVEHFYEFVVFGIHGATLDGRKVDGRQSVLGKSKDFLDELEEKVHLLIGSRDDVLEGG